MAFHVRRYSYATGAALALSFLFFAPPANASASAGTIEMPVSQNITVFPPSASGGQITYFVLDPNGKIIESTVGHLGPAAQRLASAERTEEPPTGLSPAIGQPSNCTGTGDDLDFQRINAHPFCFNGAGFATVSVTNVQEILVGPDNSAEISWHTPSTSGRAIMHANQHAYTGVTHWTADDETIC